MTDLEKAARTIFFETLKEVDIPTLIRQRVNVDGNLMFFDDHAYDLSQFAEVILIGIGKASLPMGQTLESILGSRLTRGLLVTNRRETVDLRSEMIVAGHPVPDHNSLRAGRRAIEILSNCPPDSLIIFLISGGGSSLFEVPILDEITLEDLQQLNRTLVESGANIEEINLIRKQFSAVKGGKLRSWMKSREAIGLFVSDVNAGDLKTLASNPLFPEEETEKQIEPIIERYKLRDRLPQLFQHDSIISLSTASKLGEKSDTLIHTILLAENGDVVNAAARIAQKLGYLVQVDRANDEEPYEQTSARLVDTVAELKKTHPQYRVCVVSGGEVACRVKGLGFGGRNQEFVLHCAMKLKAAGLEKTLVLSCGTDGIDGRSLAVGAIAPASRSIRDEENELLLSLYFQMSDTMTWFNESGGLLVTGPTGNNLRDLRIILSA